jgi:transposase
VVDHAYTHEEAAKAMNVGFSTIGKWVKQLKEERQGKAPRTNRVRVVDFRTNRVRV